MSETYICTCGKIITTCDYFTVYGKDCSEKERPLAKKLVDNKEACLDELMASYHKIRRNKLLRSVAECYELTNTHIFNMDLNALMGDYLLPIEEDYRKIFTADALREINSMNNSHSMSRQNKRQQIQYKKNQNVSGFNKRTKLI
jgi:hypothetical protein